MQKEKREKKRKREDDDPKRRDEGEDLEAKRSRGEAVEDRGAAGTMEPPAKQAAIERSGSEGGSDSSSSS